MNIVPIESVKKGNLFKVLNRNHISTINVGFDKPVHQICPAAIGQLDGISVQVADGYNRSTKKYSYYRHSDINHFGEKKKGTLVLIDFDF
jgi:hypothetical protein